MKVLLEFEKHHYWQEYEKTNWYCMNCGKQNVWDEQGPGDYYTGTSSVCLDCGMWGDYMGGPRASGGLPYEKTLEQLRSKETFTPTTREGN